MFLLISNQLLKMLLIMLLAFFCYKRKLIDQNGNKILSNLLLTIVNPFLILTAYQMDYQPKLVKGLILSLIIAVISHFTGIFICHFLIPAKGNPDYNIERLSSIYSNCGFMGIPLIYSILGNEGVFYLTAYMTVFNVFVWTHGLCLAVDKFSWPEFKKGMLSPTVLATFAGMLCFFAKIHFPEFLKDSMDYIADMNTPLAMMVAGLSIAQSDLRHLFTCLRLYFVSVIKLLAIPVLTLFLLVLLQVPSDVAYTSFIAAACPSATMGTMFAIKYDKNYKYASELYAFTTVLSLITIPCCISLAGLFIP